jgi:hypothetical protein
MATKKKMRKRRRKMKGSPHFGLRKRSPIIKRSKEGKKMAPQRK